MFFYSDTFLLPLPDGHRFPMDKYRLLRERLLADGTIAENQLHKAPAATDAQLLRVHTADYFQRVCDGTLTRDEIRRIGFPWSPQMVERSRRSTGATIAAAHSAMQNGIGANLAGGTHHAMVDRGAGYCVFNDVAVAVRELQAREMIQTAIVIDGDVHQGDGTAAIFADDPSCATFSLHARKAFPLRKQQSNIDIALEPGCEDADYLSALNDGLQQIVEFPHDIVFYVAGADPFLGDTLGGLKVTKPGLKERDRLVFEAIAEKPVVVVMGGGYATDIQDIVDIHASTLRLLVRRASQV